jgi:hypothetical protein
MYIRLFGIGCHRTLLQQDKQWWEFQVAIIFIEA